MGETHLRQHQRGEQPQGPKPTTSPTPSAWRWPKRCWPPSSTARPRDRRPLHLRVPRRRLPDGRHLARGLLAGRHAGLGKLIAFYDDNGISIDGHVEGWFTDDTPKRFEAYGWQVIRNVDGHDAKPSNAPAAAKRRTDKPTLICCKTTIGKGSPNKAGHPRRARRAARRKDEIAAHARRIGWNHAPFEIPGRGATPPGTASRARRSLREQLEPPLRRLPAPPSRTEAAEFERRMTGELPADWAAKVGRRHRRAAAKAENIATRKASQNAIERLAPLLPELIGGSADLAGSNLTCGRARRASPERPKAATTCSTACASSA
jgi:transketolase